MSLLIRLNKKDVSIHQALWHLQDYEFMAFSDKFKKINLHDVLKHANTEDIDVDVPNEEEIEEKVNFDDIDLVADENNKIKYAEIDKHVFKRDN